MFQKTFLIKWPGFYSLLMFISSCTMQTATEDAIEKGSTDSNSQIIQREILEKTVIGTFEQNLIDQGLTNIQEIDSTILVDLKYSTIDNFFGKDVYGNLEKAYLPLDVSEKLLAVNRQLRRENPNFRLMVFDAVRPQSIQQILWDALDTIPVNVRKAYVADPKIGSLHNYGCAVDLSIFDLSTDSLLDMGTNYDYFGYLAYPRKEDEMLAKGLLSKDQIENRLVLRNLMRNGGFISIKSEWWHFNSVSLENAQREYPLIK